MQKINQKNTSKIIILLVFAFLTYSITNSAYSQNKTSKIGLGLSVLLDEDYYKVNKAYDFYYEKKIWKGLHVGVNYHQTKIQKFVTGTNPYYYLNSNQEDSYAEWFKGKSTDYFFRKRKGASVIKNVWVVDFNINYAFFGRKFKFIPEVGYTLGRTEMAEIFLKGASYSNGKIINASSGVNFGRNYLRGYHIAFAGEWPLKNDFFIKAKFNSYLTGPFHYYRGNTSYTRGDVWYESVSLGVSIAKQFSFKNVFKKKKNQINE